MEWVAIAALSASVWWLARRLSRAEARVRRIEQEATALELQGKRARADEPASEPASRQPLPAPSRPVEVAPEPPPQPPPRAAPTPTPPLAPASPSPLAQRWQTVERSLIQNWTGILGAAIFVAGVSFLGVYTAVRLDPFLRFLMIVAAAAGLIALYAVLHRREGWGALALWLRSSGAALFLFACAAAGALPGLGIQWIYAPGPALLLLLLGMGANLFLAYAGGREEFASLHVVLSLIPLAIVPQAPTPLFIATGVTLFGIGLAYRTRWNRHLLVTVAAFGIHHAAWYVRVGGSDAELTTRIMGASCALGVGVAAALAHYQRDCASQRLARLPFLVHVTNWGLIGLWLLLYSTRTQVRGASLIAAGLAAFALARRGKSLGVRWLHLTDTLVAQGFLVGGLIALHPHAFHWLLIPGLVFLETALYVRVVLGEGEELLTRAGIYLLHASALVLGVGAIAEAAGGEESTQIALLLLGGLAAAVGVHLYLVRSRGESFDRWELYGVSPGDPAARTSALGCLLGVLAIGGLANLREGPWLGAAALLFGGSLIAVARRFTMRGAALGAWACFLAALGLAWWRLHAGHPVSVRMQLEQIVPLLVLSAGAIRWTPAGSWQPALRRVAIYALGTHFAVAAYTLFEPLSPLVPGVLWLCLSLVALEVANRAPRSTTGPVLHVGYAYLLAFAAAYLLVVLQAQSYIGLFRARLLIELFALGVVTYWFLYRPTELVAAQWSWKHAHPFLLEVGLLLLASTVSVEIASQWRPLAWAVLGLAALAPPLSRLDPRLRLYSVLFYWTSTLDVALVMSVFQTPSPRWWEQPEATALFAIAAQVAYLVRAPSRLALGEISFPRGLGRLATACHIIEKRQPLWLYYPFFAAVALWLYWRFDASLHTLLWSAEAFTVFALSVVLRESHFRYMALGALGACLLRLIAHDMSESNLALRGIVFVGVGLLMLAMNAVYNKYRARFE